MRSFVWLSKECREKIWLNNKGPLDETVFFTKEDLIFVLNKKSPKLKIIEGKIRKCKTDDNCDLELLSYWEIIEKYETKIKSLDKKEADIFDKLKQSVEESDFWTIRGHFVDICYWFKNKKNNSENINPYLEDINPILTWINPAQAIAILDNFEIYFRLKKIECDLSWSQKSALQLIISLLKNADLLEIKNALTVIQNLESLKEFEKKWRKKPKKYKNNRATHNKGFLNIEEQILHYVRQDRKNKKIKNITKKHQKLQQKESLY